jgi:hypothetical protein
MRTWSRRKETYSPNAPKDIKVCLSQLLIIRIKFFFRFFLSTLYGMDEAKKPSHATVPFILKYFFYTNTVCLEGRQVFLFTTLIVKIRELHSLCLDFGGEPFLRLRMRATFLLIFYDVCFRQLLREGFTAANLQSH